MRVLVLVAVSDWFWFWLFVLLFKSFGFWLWFRVSIFFLALVYICILVLEASKNFLFVVSFYTLINTIVYHCTFSSMCTSDFSIRLKQKQNNPNRNKFHSGFGFCLNFQVVSEVVSVSSSPVFGRFWNWLAWHLAPPSIWH